jgi:Flp pilus assembly protein TadD
LTKLEELKAAADAAYDAACDRAYAGLVGRWGDFHDARDAYQAELKKQEVEAALGAFEAELKKQKENE